MMMILMPKSKSKAMLNTKKYVSNNIAWLSNCVILEWHMDVMAVMVALPVQYHSSISWSQAGYLLSCKFVPVVPMTDGCASGEDSSVSLRTPAHVRREWAQVYGLSGFASAEYDRALDAVCTELHVNTGAKFEPACSWPSQGPIFSSFFLGKTLTSFL